LTNPQEEKFLGSEKGQEYMASCLFRAFRKYKDEQEGLKKDYDDAIENQKNLEKEVQVLIKETETVENEDDNDASTSLTKKTTADSVAAAKADKVANEESEKKYNELVAVADVALKNKNYPDAKILYEKALKIRNDKDEYTDKKLAEIAEILKKEAAEKQRKEEEADKNKIVDKNEIIKNYKDKTKKDSVKTVAEPKTSVSTATKTAVPAGAIEFKVQFASTEKEVDAKTKYPNLKDVWFYKAGAIFKYTSGSFSSFDEASKHQSKLKELGYKDCFVAAFKNGQRMDIAEAKKQAAEK